MEAGNTLEQSVALVASANKVVQDPNSVGSALRTISLRLRGTSVQVLQEMGEETDGVVESVSKMQKKIKALTGVDILTDSGAYKETYEILREIGTVWEDMSDIDQAALLELMAGKNRANTLAALLGNMEDLEGAYKDALNAEGSAMRENAAYLDSIQGRIDLFNNSLQTMWMNLLNTDVIKGIVDIGTGLMKFLDSTSGRITALGVALGVLDKFLKIGPAFNVVNSQFQIFGKTTEAIQNNFTKLSAESTGLFSKISAGFKSVFGSSNVGIDLSGMLSEDDFNAKLNTLINGFNNLDKSVTNITWDDYVNGLSNVDDATKSALKTCTEQNGVVTAGTGAYQTYTGATTSAAIGTSAVGGAAQVTTGKLIGMKIAALAANAALTMGLSIIISLATKVALSWINAGEAAKDAANNAADASQKLREQNDTLAEYKEQINELRKELDSNTLSESDAYDAREKLLTIQNDLIEKFGLERDGINLVTGAIQDQIAAIDELSQKNAQQWLNTNQKEINTAVEFFDGLTTGGALDSLGTATTITNWGVTQNVADMMREYANDPANSHIEVGATINGVGQDISFTGSVEDVKSQVEDFQNWLGIKENELQRELTSLTSMPISEQTSDVKAKIESLKQDIAQLQDVREDIGAEYINWFGDDSTYAANKAVIEEAQYNTALTQYTNEYTKILQAQNDLAEAQAKGDKEGIKAALETLNSETTAAATTAQANGQSYMVNFFNGIQEEYAKMSSEFKLEEDLLSNALFEDTGKSVKNTISGALSELQGMNAKEILQLGEIEPDNAAFVTLTSVAESYGMTIEDLCNALVKLQYIQSGFSADVAAEVVSVQSYSTLSTTLESYNEILAKTSEVVFDNVEVTQEYKDSLLELGISSEELAECFDEENKLIVTNSEQLNKLVKSAKSNIAQNAKLAKSQARLKYYELYKKMRQLTNGRKVENAATLAQVNSIYKEMSALEKVIAKYSMLEHKLLGATNAYDKLAEAQAIDEATDYGSKAEELVNVLAEAFNTAELGTEAAQVAIAGLIPDEIIDKTKTLDEQMQQIYSYFTKGTMSQLFTIEFDDDGGITSVEMTKKNIEAFTESLIGSAESGAVFQGTWDEFTLNPAITSLEEFADACGLTEEVAFAFLTSLEKYDISWLGGDNTTLLDQLMGNDFEYQAYKNIEALADLEHQMANGKITAEEYAEKYAELSAIQDENNKKIRENATAWASASTEVNTAKQRVEELTNEINAMRESGASEAEIQIKTTQLQQASEVLSDALKKKYALQEPTEMTLQIVLDDIQMQIDQWKADNAELVVDVVPKLVQDENGRWTIPADVQLKESEKAKIQEYLDLVNDQYTITVLADANPNDSTSELKEVQTAAEAAQQAIENIPDPEISTTNAQTAINTLKDTVQNLINKLYEVPRDVYTTIHEETITTTRTSGIGGVNGTAHANGTAYKSGSWGAEKTETSLVGEIGPELLVRGNKWSLVGQNGAEFHQVKKGDVIFNSKQTESLLKNGYVTGRGKAYASGTSNYSALKISNESTLDELAKYAEKLCKQYEKLVNGNVDLRQRPHLSPSYEHNLAMSGGYHSFIGTDGQIYASTSAETVTIGAGRNQYTVDITPVLEDGTVLTSDALYEYIDGLVTDGSTKDLLDSDKYNLVIRAVPGEYNEQDWIGFEEELSKYKDDYLDTIMQMFDLGGESAVEAAGFSAVGLADVVKDLQNVGSYDGKEMASAIDNASDGMRNLDNLINQYVTDVLAAKSLADDIGTDLSQTKYGNVDTDNRQKLYWDEESVDKYSDALDSWGEKAENLIGTYSTLYSVVGEYDGTDIAFTPILQTENGPQLLSADTVDQYIRGIIDKAKQNDGKWTSDELFRLDTEGLQIDGIVIKNLLEDIGQNASKTSQLLHYVGDTGALAGLEGEIQSAASELAITEGNVVAVQTKLDALNATNISDKTFTVTTIYQTIGSGINETVRTPGASGRYTKYANGTVHLSGNAFADGNVGAPRTETALVGELGTEVIVRNGRWFTVGEEGAQMFNVRRGDIIFNHLQAKQLLENGHITSRGKMAGGKAFASGTAYASINTWDDAYNQVHKDYGNSSGSGGDDNLSDAADDSEQLVDFIEMKLEEIEAIIEKTTGKIENFLDDTTDIRSKDELYDELVKAEKDKSETYLKAAQKYNVEAAAALSGVPQQYQEMARNGAIAIKEFIGEDQVEIAEAIEKYREFAAKADEAENGHLEAIAAISAHRVEQLEDIASDFENIISISQSHSELLQAEMDFVEESGNRLSESYYEELKKHSQKQLDDMQNEREALQKILDDSVAAGDVVIGSDDWYSMLGTIYDVDREIIDCKTSLEEFQNAINDLYWDSFDKFIAEIDNVNSELSNLYDLISDDNKIVDDMGNWTDDGITSLGLLAQQMENAQFKSKQYGEAIEKLKQDYADGLYSTDEYNERLSDLTESQYDAIKSYEDAKDAIVDLNKVRIDAVKDGLQKEIDAYSELIEKKKESLNSDKEAYDFQKQVEESNKNIEDIERKIAALQGDTSSSAMAQRKRLEAELLKAKEEQQDMYYDHSIEKQQEALDKELEGYTKNKEDEMDALDEYLKKEEQVISDSFDLIAENTRNIANTLIGISEEYGVSISDTVATPWINGTNAIGTYEEQLNTSVSATTANLETLKKHLEDLQTQADKTAESVVATTHSTVVTTNDGHQTSIKGYAKGSKSIKYDQWALIDELGDELQLVPNGSGRLDYIKKGTGILNNTLTEKLMDLAIDPTSVLENSRPVIGAPGITTTNNTITIDNSVGTLLHVEHLDGSNPAEVAKLVDKAWEKKMQTLNNSIKKFTR